MLLPTRLTVAASRDGDTDHVIEHEWIYVDVVE
jgi:hypothetical protein